MILNRGQIKPHQRLAIIKEFRNVCVSGKCKDPEKYSTMFEKVMSLVMNDCLVLEKPGATDGSYIVAGSVNRIFCVSSGKGRSFKCDGCCINSTTKICEHVLASAYIEEIAYICIIYMYICMYMYLLRILKFQFFCHFN